MTVVVKVGGARAVDPEGALADVATLSKAGEDVVVVHGGSTKVDDTLERMGIEPEYVETPSGVVGRFTDEETMEVFEMVFGHLNTRLVAGLQSQGVDAVGLNGVDGKLLYGPRKSAVRVVEDGKKKIRRGDHSGTIEQVNAELLESLLADGYTPVAGPPMAGEDDGEVIAVNTDADRSAAAIAGTLEATLVLLTDVEGVYEDPDDPETLIERVETPEDWSTLEDAAEGFMGRKIMAVEEALAGGTPEAVIADANAEAPITSALDGAGTHVHASALESDTDDSAEERQ
ncbi:acetylglutamate/acetylaminoadipate kinase [Halapricum hydrolyticum]|uniref:Putative [LysW]-aminoadipate/[LysW]-glutamate kinase n=1 Tax=Halapricum hydrolyticum TaxID=2979991 RepID=A0AAE3I8J9_9EURY|nr:acetylglutamate/acetylaminoadipate kinase [Halapricum hydrolyticum]MCU4716715.1 acetylglutamate/acetylaminoadipate kinase [Halapricum hydrolyticum]MCU4725680.1 acetylglutamate/acetylaminoadipate kinase [Halapricum hydrolyticum]